MEQTHIGFYGKTYTALLDGTEMVARQSGKIAEVINAASDETFDMVKTVTL